MAKKGERLEWVLEANQQAECYNTLENTIKSLYETDKTFFYAFITHNKDLEKTGEVKPTHKHAVLRFSKVGKTFEELQELFKGAHIEFVNSLSGAIAYLTHETEQAKEDGKHLYNVSEISTSDKKRYASLRLEGSKRTFNPDLILQYINEEGYLTLVDFYRDFKASDLKGWNATIKDLEKECYEKRVEARKTSSLERVGREVVQLAYSALSETEKKSRLKNLLQEEGYIR